MGSNLDRVLSTRNAAAINKDVGLTKPDTHTPSAWFLGPNAENNDIMLDMIQTALADHVEAREKYASSDPNMIASRSKDFEATVKAMKSNLKILTQELQGSIPLASHRNQSHMYWDLVMPGSVGYFAGLLYNQNNVAAEASPVTTGLEIRAANEICTMLGYDMKATPTPWGHITCDGSVANIESMWASRNLKYQAAAIARALLIEDDLTSARDMSVKTADGNWARLIDLTTWDMLNLPVDEMLDLPARLHTQCGIPEDVVQRVLTTYSIRDMGVVAFNSEILHGEASPNAVKMTPAIMVPATAHYSWVKAATVLGIGRHAIRSIQVDLDGRMRIDKLREELDKCLAEKRPVLQVVAVMGSTCEGAVDPIADILDLRDQFEGRGLSFSVHADAAWGGYFASMIREPAETVLRPPEEPVDDEHTGFDASPHEALNDHAKKQFEALGRADTITVDPHKAGFIPYPAGALCYRNKAMIFLIAEISPVVYHEGDAPSVGVYGLEGSKPGAAAVGVALSHITIPTNMMGYGRLLSRCMFNSKRFHASVVSLAKKDDDFLVVPLPRLPVERKKGGATDKEVQDQIDMIRERIADRRIQNDDLIRAFDKDPELKKLFRALGPDLTVLAYAFNFKVKGKPNRSLELLNEFNKEIFNRLSHQVPEKSGEVPKEPLFVTAAAFDFGAHSPELIQSYCERLKVDPVEGTDVRHLISTMQNPFLTATADGNFIPTLMDILSNTVEEVRAWIIEKYDLEKKKKRTRGKKD